MTAGFRKLSPPNTSVNRMTRLPGIVLAMVLVVSACGGSSSGSARTLVDSRDESDPRSIDPSLTTDVPTGRVAGYLFDGLTAFDAAANVHPALAERWDVSPDGRVYTFHLRRGVKFHDGTPFGAKHFLSGCPRVLDPKAKSGRGEPLYPIIGAKEYAQGSGKTVDGLVVRDDSTVVVTLREPNAI